MASEPLGTLHLVERGGDIARTDARGFEFDVDSGFEEAVVLVGHLEVRDRVARSLHRRIAYPIGEAVSPVPGEIDDLMTMAWP